MKQFVRHRLVLQGLFVWPPEPQPVLTLFPNLLTQNAGTVLYGNGLGGYPGGNDIRRDKLVRNISIDLLFFGATMRSVFKTLEA